MIDCVELPIRVNQLAITHQFSVVNKLITPVILGADFLQEHSLILNFSTNPVTVSCSSKSTPLIDPPDIPAEVEPILQAERSRQAKFCAVMAVEDPAVNIVNDAVIPLFGGPTLYEYPSHVPEFLCM